MDLMDYQWIINALLMDYQWIINGFNGLLMDY
jgi:hypothetical protein